MKVLGVLMIHYGKDYLKYAIESIHDVCDKVIILYSMVPTHNQSGLRCPDSLYALTEIAHDFKKVQWVNVYDAHNEAEHLSHIWKFTEGYDVLIRSDYDEIWKPGELEQAIASCYNSPYRQHGIDGFIHFWRSFRFVSSGDSFRPIRLIHLREKNTSQQPSIKSTIYHFGYAIPPELMRYKLSIHGHKGEIKDHWFRNVWNSWTPEQRTGTFHPTSNQIWLGINDFDREQLPKMLHEHKYFNTEII